MVNRPKPAPVRFERNITLDGECWRWTGNINDSGYGRFGVEHQNVRAHRWSYEFHIAEIPPGLVLDHLCRNTWCVNPWHPDPVPQRVNAQRGETGRHLKERTHCERGHEYTQENTLRGKKGYRRCRECHRVNSLARYYRRKEYSW